MCFRKKEKITKVFVLAFSHSDDFPLPAYPQARVRKFKPRPNRYPFHCNFYFSEIYIIYLKLIKSDLLFDI